MQFTRRYNLINNTTGWVVFVIALVTYWLTLEPTASYWDCGEFITQADKLGIGHPPGNPIFMLTARFFSNFAFGDAYKVALMVNAMSGLLSALTILLLFWTITHLASRLLLRSTTTADMTLPQYLVIMGSGVAGALAYTWSDTFWFSAVEGEVYAFSSFCTALVFWLILKWENRADKPHSDRYLILIAYIIGVSIAVHLLNLLCIPAIVLVFTYRKWKDMSAIRSLLALLVGFGIIILVLYGLVPGFIKVAGWLELSAVNWMHLPYNSGTIIYTALTLGAFVWGLWELHTQRSAMRIRISFCLGVLLSGMLFILDSVWLGLILLCVLIFVVFFIYHTTLPMRWMNVVLWSIFVIFIGYSSYALILIRSHANPPLNQSQPDNVFSLSGYLNREQYGETPLLYGMTYQSPNHYIIDSYADLPIGGGEVVPNAPVYKPDIEKGKARRFKGVKGAQTYSPLGFLSKKQQKTNRKLAAGGGDYYVVADYESKFRSAPNMNMLLPRIHSRVPEHRPEYEIWVPSLADPEHGSTTITARDKTSGKETDMVQMNAESLQYNEFTGEYNFVNPVTAIKPTFGENLQFFFNYQLNHMYWRYFLWNFVGRQNDYNNQRGEKDYGNWISGINFIDNARLGDQSALPDYLGKGNRAHNVFYFLPLILGIIGLLWQAFKGRRGIEQFWVVFFLFFMTGIAIVLYLNQPPLQPRERDYAFAGSFYAFAIWIGLGVAALWNIGCRIAAHAAAKEDNRQSRQSRQGAATAAAMPKDTPVVPHKKSLLIAAGACLIGLIVPLQMVSQTWDDHDRSGRYAARDFAVNYLESLEPNAIIFCNGDNDTFPLWYAQEVEGVRPDVKIINLSYLQSDWYINQQRVATYAAPGVNITATPAQIAYGRRDLSMTDNGTDIMTPTPMLDALKAIFSNNVSYNDYGYAVIPFANTYIEIDKEAVRKRGLTDSTGLNPLVDRIIIDLNDISNGQLSLSQLIMLDIIATNAANGWERPIYWAGTVGSNMYSMFQPYLRAVGMTYQLVPYEANQTHDTARSYNVVKNKYRWGGADATPTPYFDEAAGRMVSYTRMTTFLLATDLVTEAQMYSALAKEAKEAGNAAGEHSWLAKANENCRRAVEVLDLSLARLPIRAYPFAFIDYYQVGSAYCKAGSLLGNKKVIDKGLGILERGMKAYAANVRYVNKLIEKYGSAVRTIDDKEYSVPYTPAVQTSAENAQILALYYDLAIEYATYAGEEAAMKALARTGIKNPKFLKSYYDMSHGNNEAEATYDSDEDYGESYTAEDIYTQVMLYVPDVLKIQSLSAADYAALDDKSLSADSLFMYLVDLYEGAGGDRKAILDSLRKKGINVERSTAVYQTFKIRNPDLFAEQ